MSMEQQIQQDIKAAMLAKEKTRLEGEIKRGEGMLGNPNFVGKAPAEKVEAEKAKLQKYKETYEQVLERIAQLA